MSLVKNEFSKKINIYIYNIDEKYMCFLLWC